MDKIVIDTDDSEYVLTNSHSCEIMRINKYNNNLLDILISLAPKRIIINKITDFTDRELLKIIITVFKERVEMYMN